MNTSNAIIFFDGNCMLCNAFIGYVIKKEIPHLFFCDLNLPIAKDILSTYKLSNQQLNTIYLIENNQPFHKSTAVLRVFMLIHPQQKLLYKIALRIPLFLRDSMYTLIAKNRHRLFKSSTCFLPTQKQQLQILK